ncbi:unnamed protein product [Nippostrongylus brasiliensis]|uniref:Uncharacterized protein n=1 Tax=Nippostrongylus brasiliensis TaxID=27835 RepID=A0A0N4Y7M8_NIPBR|nr:unnamed protein product [Nippostrongylus brasiliensis]
MLGSSSRSKEEPRRRAVGCPADWAACLPPYCTSPQLYPVEEIAEGNCHDCHNYGRNVVWNVFLREKLEKTTPDDILYKHR